MDFLKKHYEKILLTLVLLGSVGLLVSMPFFIQADRDEANKHTAPLNQHPKPLPDLDLTLQNQLVQRVNAPLKLDLETTNKLFNPLEWQKALDGRLIKKESIGEKALVIAAIHPLYLLLTLDKVETNEPGAPRYSIAVQHQAAAKVSQQRVQHHFVSVGDKIADAFQLLSIKGPAENPDELVLKLADTGEIVNLSAGKPYQRVDGYTADLHYDPERKVYTARRVGAALSFGGDDYNIVAIDADKVILSNQSNQKRTEFKYTP